MGKKHFDDYDEYDFEDDYQHKRNNIRRRNLKRQKEYYRSDFDNFEDEER